MMDDVVVRLEVLDPVVGGTLFPPPPSSHHDVHGDQHVEEEGAGRYGTQQGRKG